MKIYITISLLTSIIFTSCSKQIDKEVIAPPEKTNEGKEKECDQ